MDDWNASGDAPSPFRIVPQFPAVVQMGFTHVDKPFRIKGVALKNRVCRSAHATGYSDLGVTDDLISYHEARARGGVAMSILEIFSVH